MCHKQRGTCRHHSPLPAPAEPCGRVATPSPVWLAEGMGVRVRHCSHTYSLSPLHVPRSHTPETSITPVPECLRHSVLWPPSPHHKSIIQLRWGAQTTLLFPKPPQKPPWLSIFWRPQCCVQALLSTPSPTLSFLQKGIHSGALHHTIYSPRSKAVKYHLEYYLLELTA